MSDLTLDDTVFHHLKTTFSSISDRMEATRRTLRGTDASAVGEAKLIEDVQDFADEWGYGIKQLGKHTHGAVKMINTIGDTFGKLDLDLAASLKAARTKKGK
ncbi:hypothetical protein ACFW4O_02640 [Streptomyces mutabilis]|jgi:hypothetical protein|uniref:hypothetical protein n=1 Tax=Streptomyces mutabilis TaxID=67332 RepID=UPI000BC3FE04|nr:hypothetical protein [Streptomyces sp. alain-838]PAK26853.1 hypothetical protein CJD44_07660 [Streptomyces sp. alain-838]